MPKLMPGLLRRAKAKLKPISEVAIGDLAVGALRATRYFDDIKTANFFGRMARRIAPLTR